MKVFVLGASGVGKTPMARRLAAALAIPHLGASGWVRARFPADPSSFPDRAAFVAAITGFALAELARDPRVSIDDLATRADLDAPCVIEGVRNPFDFVHLFDPRHDVAITLDSIIGPVSPTAFERGLDVIAAYLDWLTDVGLLHPSRRLRYRIDRWYDEPSGSGSVPVPVPVPVPDLRSGSGSVSLEHAILDAIATIHPPSNPPLARPATVHAEIPSLRALIRAEYLHGMDPSRAGELVPASVFAVSSYPGSTVTFKVRLADGAVFSYLPPTALLDVTLPGEPAPLVRDSDVVLELADLAYHDARDERICVHRFAELAGPALAWFKRPELWLTGRYLFTIDWWTGNDLLHAVALGNGQLALLPHHKLKLGAAPDGGHERGFAPYRKLRRTWTIGRPEDT